MKIRYTFYLVTMILAFIASCCENLGLQIALTISSASVLAITELLCRLAVRYE